MSRRPFLRGILFLAIALSLPVIIFAQQSPSARRNTPERPAPGVNTPTNKSVVSPSMIRTDLGEALSVIQANYIDGKKVDYNTIFMANEKS